MHHHTYNINPNLILLTTTLFGTVYIFTNTLKNMNDMLLENKKISLPIYLINIDTIFFSGSLFVFSVIKTIKNS